MQTLSCLSTPQRPAFRSLRRMPRSYPWISGVRPCRWRILPIANRADWTTFAMVLTTPSHTYGRSSLLPLLHSTRIRRGWNCPKMVDYGIIWGNHRRSREHTTPEILQSPSTILRPTFSRVSSRRKGRSFLNRSRSDVNHSLPPILDNFQPGSMYHWRMPPPLLLVRCRLRNRNSRRSTTTNEEWPS